MKLSDGQGDGSYAFEKENRDVDLTVINSKF